MRILSGMVGLMVCLFSATHAYADDFSVTTNAFLDTGALPVLYTCDGQDLSPQLNWTNPPAKTQSYAVLMTDPEAPNGTFYHWVVYNLPASTKELAEGVKSFPPNTLLGVNSWGKNQYNGPCPPKGTAHKYIITLYALSSPVKLPAGADGKAVLDAMQGHILKEVQLSTIYSRWLQ